MRSFGASKRDALTPSNRRFSGAEPSLVKGFDAKQWVRVIRSCQIILDRFRDARVAFGTAPLDDRVMEHFVQHLVPYRRRANRFVRGSMYTVTSALQAKLALPGELPSTSSYLPAFVHDLLVLSSRLARQPGGLEVVKGPEMSRYMVYLLGVTSAGLQLDELVEAIRVRSPTLASQIGTGADMIVLW